MLVTKMALYNKYFIFLFLICFGLTECRAQINETPLDRYIWGKKRTEIEDGYVILRNGKRLDGQIQLAGRPDAVNKIIFIRDGKELELDPVNIKAYGLNVAKLTNESPEEMYIWSYGMTRNVNGVTKVPSSTKNMKGYVVLLNGKRKEGILHLNAINNQLDEFVIKTEDEGKLVYKPAEVVKYGLNPLISDINNNGSRVFEEDGKNIRIGFYLKTDGTKISGFLGFLRAEETSTDDVYLYLSAVHTASIDIPLNSIATKELAKVVQLKGDTEIVYVPFNGGFVLASQMMYMAIEDQYRMFQPGKIILLDSTEIKGNIAQNIPPGNAYSSSIKFKGTDGAVKEYDCNSIKFFEQTIKNMPHGFIAYRDRFVYLMFNGETFAFYKNPFPTTINSNATTAARLGSSLAGSLAAGAAVNSTKGTSEKGKEELKKNIVESSAEENKENMKKLYAANSEIQKSDLPEDVKKEAAKDVAKVQTAMVAEDIGNQLSENLVIYNVEYFVWNKKKKEKTLIIKNDFSDDMEKVLKTCNKYIALPKEEQKKCRKLANIVSTMKVLDQCPKN